MDYYRPARSSDFRKNSGCLFIGNVPYTIGETELFEIFDRIGPVDSVVIGKDKRTGNHRGHAFVQYKNPQDAQLAYERLKGFTVKDRQLRIDFDAGLESKARVFTSRMPETSRYSPYDRNASSRYVRSMGTRRYSPRRRSISPPAHMHPRRYSPGRERSPVRRYPSRSPSPYGRYSPRARGPHY